MKQNKKLGFWFVLLAILAVCFVTLLVLLLTIPIILPPAPANLTEAMESQRSVVLESGKSFRLDIPEKLMTEDVTFTSDNEQVATVDADGRVTAVGKGMARIAVSDSDETAYCGVVVDSVGMLIDVSVRTAQEVFSGMELHSVTEITGLAVDPENQAVYLAQSYGTSPYVPLNSDIVISKVEQKEDAWVLGSWMRFTGSGKGSICMDNDAQTSRLWMEVGGDVMGYGKAVSLVDWEDETYCQDSYGQVFRPEGVSGTVTVSADPGSNMVLVYDRNEKCYKIYDRAAMLAGEENPVYVHRFSCAANQKPAVGDDDSKGRYNASIRGYALYDGYLYQLSGSTSIYLSVFDLEGTLQYCHRIEDHPELDYRMPASICVADGKIYIAVASGSSEHVLANLWVFE